MRRLALRHAAALGAMHGPAELLPISSSGHVTLVPWLLGWDYATLEPGLRKAFEVSLHAGTAAAMLVTLREEARATLGSAPDRLALLIALSFLPPAAAGYLLQGPIERRLGRPGSIAAGLVLGSLAMLASDRAPTVRRRQDAGARDAIWLGFAQASALMPGVSRGGATLAVARRRGFGPTDASILSRHIALPVIAAATGRSVVRLLRQGLPAGSAPALGLGALTSFLSTLCCTRVIGAVEREGSLTPFVIYRLALASIVVRRLSREAEAPRDGAVDEGSGASRTIAL